jgi:hypothetical protein
VCKYARFLSKKLAKNHQRLGGFILFWHGDLVAEKGHFTLYALEFPHGGYVWELVCGMELPLTIAHLFRDDDVCDPPTILLHLRCLGRGESGLQIATPKHPDGDHLHGSRFGDRPDITDSWDTLHLFPFGKVCGVCEKN